MHDADLPMMLATTLSAHDAVLPETSMRALRLGLYGGMQQGIVITGEDEARQWVFNAATGQPASETESTGRWMDLFAGLSLLYLTISGAVMYLELWRKRHQAGRHSLLWK